MIFEDGRGARITILESGSRTLPLRFRMILPQGYRVPSAEFHPAQSEEFRVLRGTLGLGKIHGKNVVLRAGETFRTDPGVLHLPANLGDGELELEATLTPGLESGAMFASLYTSIRAHRGLARAARGALVLQRFRHVIDFSPPVRTGMKIVASIANWFGMKVEKIELSPPVA